MFLWKEPRAVFIRDFLNQQARSHYSYKEVGFCGLVKPAGYFHERRRLLLGKGEGTFEQARKAVESWKMFRFDWLQVRWPYKTLKRNAVYSFLCLHPGMHSLHAVAIVRVVNSVDDGARRAGFAYGTLKDHALSGEQSFLVHMDEEGRVWFEIVTFWRPKHWLAWALLPLTVRLQRQFTRTALYALRSSLAVTKSIDEYPEWRRATA